MGNSLQTYDSLTAVVPGSGNEELELGPIYRQKKSIDGLKLQFFEGCDTLWDLFCHGVQNFPTAECLGKRLMTSGKLDDHFTFRTYKEVETEVIEFSNGIQSLEFVKPIPFGDHKRSDGENYHLIGFLSSNRMEWTIAEYGLFRCNAACVPLYDVLSAGVIDHIIQETGMEVMICDGARCPVILSVLEQNRSLPLKALICFDPLPDESLRRAQALNVAVLSYESVLARGREASFAVTPPTQKDPCMIVYTSGTTGEPKGVVIPHCSLASLAQSTMHHHVVCRAGLGHYVLSYLPLAHVFEQFCEANILSSGGAIGFYTDKEHLMEDIRVLRPTVFASVPRIFNRMRDTILNKVRSSGGLKQYLFNRGMDVKGRSLDELNCVTHRFYDIIFGKIKSTIGLDRLQFALSGSAPLSADVLRFFRIVFGVPVIQGYGMTESGGGLCCEIPDCYNSYGTCGAPVVASEVRLVSVPELGYLVSDKSHGELKEGGRVVEAGEMCCGRGEVVFRGYNMTMGYFRRPDLTRVSIDESGWFHTGDIGLWTKEGFLRIIDRKKNIIKLSQGEYVAIEKIENNYLLSPFIDQIMAYGDSYQSQLIGIVVPDFTYVRYWLESHSMLVPPTNDEMARLPEVKSAILSDMNDRIAKEKKMSSLEFIRHIHLESKPFTLEEDLITPTMKLKRIQIKQKFLSELKGLYQEIAEESTSPATKADH